MSPPRPPPPSPPPPKRTRPKRVDLHHDNSVAVLRVAARFGVRPYDVVNAVVSRYLIDFEERCEADGLQYYARTKRHRKKARCNENTRADRYRRRIREMQEWLAEYESTLRK